MSTTIAARAEELHREQTSKRQVVVSRMFAVLLVVSLVQFVVLNRRVHYGA